MSEAAGIDINGLTVFFLCTVGLMLLSRNSLRNRHSYGYYRFFGFEFILLLLMTTAEVWFKDPLSPLQLASWLALVLALTFMLDSLRCLGVSRATGKEGPGDNEMVRTGLYGYVRHPLYSSLLLLALGTLLKSPSLFTVMLFIGASFSINATAKAEETFNLQKFGESYREYMTNTKMFVPFLF